MSAKENIRLALLPFSWLYGIGVWFRNKLFDRGLLPSETYPVPVISVGNLNAGGSGKTPHTEYLIELLQKRYRLAVLSRGYKRKTKGFLIADENASAETVGDEPYQLYRKYPAVLVAVDENRREGIGILLDLPASVRPEVILLDDAFQHRYVKPSLSILLTDSACPYTSDRLLPAGRLRESKAGARRADVIIATKTPDSFTPADYSNIAKQLHPEPSQDLFFTSYDYKGLLPVFPDYTNVKKETHERLRKNNYALLLVAGIANPEPLKTYLRKFTNTFAALIYRDHHAFTQRDMSDIKQAFDQLGAKDKLIITTEKDAVRMINSPYVPESIKPYIFYQPIEVKFNINQEESFNHKIYNHVDNFKRNSILA